MMYYQPTHLRQTREAVQKVHPHTREDWDNPQVTANLEVGKRLLQRLRTTPRTQLKEFTQSLKPMERHLLSGFVIDQDPTTRSLAIACMLLAPHIAQARHLWRAVTLYFGHETSRQACHLLKTLPTAGGKLTAAQQTFVQHFERGIEDALYTGWQRATAEKLTIDRLQDALDFQPRDALTDHLEDYFLTRAPREVWEAQPDEYLHTLYCKTNEETQFKTFLNAYARYTRHHHASASQNIQRLILELATQPTLRQRLKTDAPEVWQWCQVLLRQHEISLFFRYPADPERSRFWQDYVPRMRELHINDQERRLFMDFGAFGVVEFGDVGNAAYVYEAQDFQKLVARERSSTHQVVPNSRFKMKAKAIRSLDHRGGWQSIFHQYLHYWLTNLE